MDHDLSTYYGRKDLAKRVIESCNIIQGTARDSGSVYYAIEIEFVNGYKKRIFPNEAERFAILNAYDFALTSNQIDNNI